MNKYVALALAALTSACAVGPDYQRPASELPTGWEEITPEENDATRLGNWWRQFGDSFLVVLIEESLLHNNDLKVAAANVEAAAAALQLARADYIPTVNAGADATRSSASESSAFPLPDEPYTEYSAGLVVNYELDLWGRVRRANEAAFAELRADIAVHDTVRAAVAAAVARAYFEARALDLQVALLERLHQTRQENLQLQETRHAAGVVSSYDVEQARSEMAAIAAELPQRRAARRHALTALAVLRGTSPRTLYMEWQATREAERIDPELLASTLPAELLTQLPDAPAVPMGLPSELLERRPDIRAAEQHMVAANARIGEAKAAYFPRLSLTGFAGGISTAFGELFDSPSQSWEAGLGLSIPLTDINRIGANVDAAEASLDAATANYAKTVLVAFRETLDALTTVESARAVMQAQDERVLALQKAYGAAQARYRAGSIGYLGLLDVERQLRRVEQARIDARLALLKATVDLYQALGGGWQEGGHNFAETRHD